MDTALSEGGGAQQTVCWNSSREASGSGGPFFGPITSEKVMCFSMLLAFKYRKDLSVPFHVLPANMNEPHTESYNTDVSAKAGCTWKQSTRQVAK